MTNPTVEGFNSVINDYKIKSKKLNVKSFITFNKCQLTCFNKGYLNDSCMYRCQKFLDDFQVLRKNKTFKANKNLLKYKIGDYFQPGQLKMRYQVYLRDLARVEVEAGQFLGNLEKYLEIWNGKVDENYFLAYCS